MTLRITDLPEPVWEIMLLNIPDWESLRSLSQSSKGIRKICRSMHSGVSGVGNDIGYGTIRKHVEYLRLSESRLPYPPTEPNKCDNLYWAIYHGDMFAIKWLYRTFNFTKEDILEFQAFIKAASFGHLSVLQWMHKTFNLNKEDAHKDNHQAFIYSAGSGHLQVLQWLHLEFDFDNAHVDAFHLAAKYGHLSVLKWMNRIFSFDKTNKLQCLIRRLYSSNYCPFEVRQWLRNTYVLS